MRSLRTFGGASLLWAIDWFRKKNKPNHRLKLT
jgi:hypothetical protein